jgi:hypothetical protein
VGLFRRREETLNERLLREAGLDQAQTSGAVSAPPAEPAPEPKPPASAVRSDGEPHHLALGPKEWDTAVAVRVPGLPGHRIEFTTIPNGDVLVSEESGDGDVSPLADAVEQHVSPPYRATAIRQDGDLWGVGAKRIEVAQIPMPAGDRLQLSRNGDERDFRIDTEPSHAPIPAELERLGEAAADSFYIEADRIDGDLWEVRATAL